jgi:hypothetical protein
MSFIGVSVFFKVCLSFLKVWAALAHGRTVVAAEASLKVAREADWKCNCDTGGAFLTEADKNESGTLC